MGNPIRTSKVHYATHGYDAAGGISAYGFDTVSMVWFPLVPSIGAGVANTVIQASIPLAQRCEIVKVVLNFTAIGTGVHSFNIVSGTGVEGVIGSAWTVAAAGAIVFSADQTFSVQAANTPAIYLPSVMTVWYDTASLLTLRVVTPAATGSISNLSVGMLVNMVDALFAKQDAGSVTAPNF
jgi:hypothetical protein